MTSIITFKLDNGNQRIIIGDTQHIYRASTHENSKIFPLKDKKLIFCGAGNDRVIDGINTRIISIDDLDFCSDKIKEFKEGDIEGKFVLYELYERDRLIRNEEIQGTQFLVIDTNSLDGKKITNSIPISIGNIEIIGSGSEFVGFISDLLESLYNLKFNTENETKIMEIILKSLSVLGKQDSSTGHPAIFKLEGYLLEKNTSPKKIDIKFNQDIEKLTNYNYEVKEE